MKFKNKLGQQEMVGFVLIVVLVMVGLMVFLVISVRGSDNKDSTNSVVSNMLDIIMRTTIDCNNLDDNFEDLSKSCFKGDFCSNLNESACDYLNESLGDVVSSMVLSDASVDGWSVDFFKKDEAGIMRWSEGECNGTSSGAQRNIPSGGTNLVMRLRICSL